MGSNEQRHTALFRTRVARRILVLFLACALLPLLLITVLAFRQVMGHLYDQSYARLHSQSKALAMSIVERLQLLEADLHLVVSHLGAEAVPAEALPVAQLEDHFVGLVVASDGGVKPLLDRATVEPRELAPGWLDHLRQGGTVVDVRTRDRLLADVVMVRAVDPNQPQRELVWATVNPEFLWGVGVNRTLPLKTELCVVDGARRTLIRSVTVPDSFVDLTAAAVGDREQRWFEWSDDDREYLAGYWQVPMETNYLADMWTVVISEARSDVLAPVIDFKRDFPLTVLLSVWVVLLLSISQIRRILDPLQELQQGTRRLANQDFSGRAEVSSGDEFEELADAFNVMSNQLGQQFGALSAMAAVGRAALSALSVDAIVGTTLEGLRGVAHAELAWVTLLAAGDRDSASAYLAPWCREESVPAAFLEWQNGPVSHDWEQQPAREELEAGGVVHKRLVAGPAPSADPFGMRASGLRSLLVVPIQGEQRLIGALTLASKDEDTFDDGTRAHVAEVADQLAVALNSARLQAALEQEKMRLAGILEQLPNGVVVLDGNHRVVLANRIARETLPVLTTSGVGDTLEALGEVSVDELVVAPTGTRRRELVVDTPEHRVFEVIGGRLEGVETLDAIVLVLGDVTQERETERRVQRQERLAAVGQLAAGISHDFNNVLQGIVMAGEVLKMVDTLPPEMKVIAEGISVQGHRGAELIRQILDFTRKSAANPKPVALVPLIEETVSLLRRTIPENIAIELDVQADDCMVMSDSTQLQQVVTNMALNARDAMPRGGLFRIRLAALEFAGHDQPPMPEMTPGRWVCLAFEDTGVGMPQEVVEHVFEPFFTTKEAGKGTGLGLAQVYGIVSQHGGVMDVTSREGEGTVFTVYLPRADTVEVEAREQQTEALPRGDDRYVLVVEDDPSLLRSTTVAIEQLGYRVLAATSASAAIELFEDRVEPVDLVLCDLVLPGASGEDVVDALRRHDPDVRIVVMTGYPVGEGDGDVAVSGTQGLLHKPFSMQELAVALKQALSR